MTTLHAHPSVGPRPLLLSPWTQGSPARAAALGFAIGLALSFALLPLAQRLGSEPSPTPIPARRAPSFAPSLTPPRPGGTGPIGPAPLLPRSNAAPLTSQPRPSDPLALLPESEIAEELFEGEPAQDELPEADVEAGLAQAEALCARVRELGQGPWGRLPVDAIRRLLEAPAIEAESYGELPAIRSELDWIAGLRSAADLGPRSLEDLRFLAATIHWYLEGASEPLTGAAKHLDRPAEFDAERLREFVGMDYADLLAEWD